MGGIDEASDEQTEPPEPHLVRAQSLRMEQERKISNFIEVFGGNGGDAETRQIKTYSPEKKKKIVKARKGF